MNAQSTKLLVNETALTYKSPITLPETRTLPHNADTCDGAPRPLPAALADGPLPVTKGCQKVCVGGGLGGRGVPSCNNHNIQELGVKINNPPQEPEQPSQGRRQVS